MYKIPANTLFIGKNLVYVPQCHSTNDLALQLCQQSSATEGTVIITNNQTAGRGQRGNQWEASQGMNFTLSVIVKPKVLAIKDQFYLNIVTALAVRDFCIEKTKHTVYIKWPNDVLAAGKKVCGILIENQIQGNRFSNAVIGIGLNMNQKSFSVSTASSLGLLEEKEYILADELALLLHKFEARYMQLHQQQYQKLMADYLASLYWLNETRMFATRDKEFEGIIQGIDAAGRLTIYAHGNTLYFDVKEVSHVR